MNIQGGFLGPKNVTTDDKADYERPKYVMIIIYYELHLLIFLHKCNIPNGHNILKKLGFLWQLFLK